MYTKSAKTTTEARKLQNWARVGIQMRGLVGLKNPLFSIQTAC